MEDNRPVFYVPGKPGIIDLAIMREGVLRGGYSNETQDEMALRYPGVQVGELGKVAADSEEMFRVAPVEVDEARFMYMLEVLPPVGWKRSAGSESFKLSERTSGNITAILCRIGDRYFEMQDSIFTKHDDVLRAVLLKYPEAA